MAHGTNIDSNPSNNVNDGDDLKADDKKPIYFEGTFAPFDIVAVTGSYLGKASNLNGVKQFQMSGADSTHKPDTHHNPATCSTYIDAFNQRQANLYPKVNRSLKKSSSASSNAHSNFWDREYSAVCIAQNIPLHSIQKYVKLSSLGSSDETKMEQVEVEEQATCDAVIKCGGCFSAQSTLITALCDGFLLNRKGNNVNECVPDHEAVFSLPKLQIARSNCSAIFNPSLGVICYGGRSSSNKQTLNNFEVLNVAHGDAEWNTQLIPNTKDSRSRHPSIGIYDDKLLFVCGGRGVCSLKECECINIEEILHSQSISNKWQRISAMNYSRSFCSNLVEWKQRNSVIVMGGHGEFHAEFYAEQFDIEKNAWIALPKCNCSHKYNPVIKLTSAMNDSEHELLCVLCDKRTKANLGVVEILDIRTKKWMKCKTNIDDFLQFSAKQELRRALLYG